MSTRIISAVRGNVVAWLALFVALGGTGLAASHYVITSTRQIKPSVLRTLRGHAGPPGPIGPAGPIGPQGAPANESTVKQLQSQVAELRSRVSEVKRSASYICEGIRQATKEARLKAISEPARWKALEEALETMLREAERELPFCLNLSP